MQYSEEYQVEKLVLSSDHSTAFAFNMCCESVLKCRYPKTAGCCIEQFATTCSKECNSARSSTWRKYGCGTTHRDNLPTLRVLHVFTRFADTRNRGGSSVAMEVRNWSVRICLFLAVNCGYIDSARTISYRVTYSRPPTVPVYWLWFCLLARYIVKNRRMKYSFGGSQHMHACSSAVMTTPVRLP